MDKTKILFEEQLIDALCIEEESEKVIPKLQKSTKDEDLERILEAQLITTKSHIKKLITMGEILGIDLKEKDCTITRIVVSKVEQYLNDGPVNDIGILMHLERVNQYKIAIYNASLRFAKELKYQDLFDKLQNITNHTYNIMDRLGRLDNNKSDWNALNNI